jgi:lysophospholipase L1-like esterase
VQPSLVIIYFGGNDSIHPHPSGLGPHVPLEEYVENMRKIANYLKVINDFSPSFYKFFIYILSLKK